jgi:hypothetical protein
LKQNGAKPRSQATFSFSPCGWSASCAMAGMASMAASTAPAATARVSLIEFSFMIPAPVMRGGSSAIAAPLFLQQSGHVRRSLTGQNHAQPIIYCQVAIT